MIHFISTFSHKYTHAQVAEKVPEFKQISYGRFFRQRRKSPGTYIFSDLDRLSFWQLEVAAHYYKQMKLSGWNVLNDPARVLNRFELLQTLKLDGLNSFSVWPAIAAREVDRYPVFLRTRSAHRGNLTDLITNERELITAVSRLNDEGYPMSDLMISEYRASPSSEGVFRKLSVHRIADTYVAMPSVHERHWSAKNGTLGAAGAEGYAADLADISSGRFCDVVAKRFEAANIDYGRADFGLVDGNVEVYEINTNPMMTFSSSHPFKTRVSAFNYARTGYLNAIRRLDTHSPDKKVCIPLPPLIAQHARRLRGLFPGYQWMP